MQMSQDRYDKAIRNHLLNVLYPRPPFAVIRPKRWMASTDINPRLVGYLRQLFPEVRLIYLVRNGIEVVSSRMVFEGFKDRPFAWQCEVWAQAEKMVRWGAAQNYFYLVRHESLLDRKSVTRVLAGLWSWLGLKNDPRCAEVMATNSYHPTILTNETPGDAKNLDRRKGRWEFWSDEERSIFVDTCSSAMAYLGYEIPWLARPTE